jgi:hypothetical protein
MNKYIDNYQFLNDVEQTVKITLVVADDI